jgi:hypothetical protein
MSEPQVDVNRVLAETLARGMLQIADIANMPDTFWEIDSRIRLAREVLSVPKAGRYSYAHLWSGDE